MDRSAVRRPVFVDASGQRLRWARIGGLVAVAGLVAYVGLVVSAFLGGPNVVGPLLPSALAPQHNAAESRHILPSPPTATERPVPAPGTKDSPQIPPPAQVIAPVVSQTSATQTPATASSPTPTTTPTTAPGRSATAPGQANRPPAPKKP